MGRMCLCSCFQVLNEQLHYVIHNGVRLILFYKENLKKNLPPRASNYIILTFTEGQPLYFAYGILLLSSLRDRVALV